MITRIASHTKSRRNGLRFSLTLLLAAALTTVLLFADAGTVSAGSVPFFFPHAAPDATITVNSTADVIADDGQCTLREAITAANSDTVSGITPGECPAGSGADTITLPAGAYTLALAGAGEDANANGDLDITGDIHIDGAGYDSTFINAAQIDRVLHVHSGATVELNRLALTNGRSLSGSGALCHGGGVRNQGSLTIQSSIVSGNFSGTDISGNGCNGGGVYNEDTLILENSIISGNFAADASPSTNGFGGHGGGLFVLSGTVTIEDSTISGNTTGNGDGFGADGHGGGMSMDGGTVILENSTVSGNTARGSGGGMHNDSASMAPSLAHVTITDNIADGDEDDNGDGGGLSWMAGGANVKNTIIADNDDKTDAFPSGSNYDDCYGALDYTSQGYNLVGNGTGCPTSGTDLGDDAKIASSEDNNSKGSDGITHTHALQHNSPAAERIPVGINGCGSTYSTDQRGENRPQGGLCDVGAHESSYILWDGDAVDNNTSTAANWSGDTTPATTDIPVFNDTSEKNATVDSALTVGGWTIDSEYDGTINAGNANLDVDGQWRQEGGTFSGGSGTLDLEGGLTLSGGTFTAPAPAGEMTLAGDFVQSDGTFAANGGIVVFDGPSAQTLEVETARFWDLTVNAGSTLIHLGTSDFNVDGVLTNNGALQRSQNVNGSGNFIFFYTGGYGGLVLDPNGSDLGSTTVKIEGNQDCTDVAGETVQRCFDIEPSNTTDRDAVITFYFADGELSGHSCTTLEAYHWNDSVWEKLARDESYNGDGRACGSEPYSLRVQNVSDFSPFALSSSTTLAVSLGYFLAEANGDGQVTFTWQTAAESGVAGFHLLADNGDGSKTRLNGKLIPSPVIDSVTTTTYRFTASTVITRFYLQEIGVDGSITEHGPFDPGVAYGSFIHASENEVTPVLWLPVTKK